MSHRLNSRRRIAPIDSTRCGGAAEVIKNSTRRAVRETRGNVSLMFGLLAIPLLLGAGMAVDIARKGFHQQQLNSAIDGAALAVAKMEDGATNEQMVNLARQYIDLNYTKRDGLNGNEITLSVDLDDNVVTVTADVDVPTTITRLVGVFDMKAHVSAEVTKEVLGTEIALVLDNTGSMSHNGKIDALEDAADTLLDVLFAGTSSTNKLKIAVVPFSAAVNVGTNNDTAAWLDTTGVSDVATMNFQQGGWHNWRGWQELSNRSWNGCVQARAMPYDIQDDEPNPGVPDTLFAP